MNYTTLQLGEGSEGSVFDVNSLYGYFARLADRRHARGKRYQLALVLVLVVLAKLSGEDQPTAIAEWARLRQDVLSKVLGVAVRMPCHNTYRRVLADAVDGQELQEVVKGFLHQEEAPGCGVLISLDGKTLRGTIPKGQSQGVHLLAAYVPAEGIVLMQVAVAHKDNELTAAPTVLSCLDLRGKVVMGDALFTQRQLSVQILEAGGDYIWWVKENQPQLRRDIEVWFGDEPCVKGFSPPGKDFQIAHSLDKAHGRQEERTLTTSSLLCDYLHWPGVSQVFQVQRRIRELSTTTLNEEVAYGLTSLPPHKADAKTLLTLTRSHWQIENCLHYRRDKTLREDATRMKSPSLAFALATINNLIIALTMRQHWPFLPSARRHYAARLDDALVLVPRPLH